MPFKDQVIVVTGAGRGIGAALAKGFAFSGGSVVCAARTKSEVDRTVEEILSSNGIAHGTYVDVTRSDDVGHLFRCAAERFGGVDILVVNAGDNFANGSADAGDLGDWKATFDVNFFGAADCARQAVPYLRHRGGGKILFIGSGLGHRGKPGFAPYACSKAALWMLTRVLAQELRTFRIAVNEIIPGPVQTGLAAKPTDLGYEVILGLDSEGSAAPLGSEGLLNASTPANEWTHEWFKQPEDVVPLALFVASLPNHGPTAQSFSLMGRSV